MAAKYFVICLLLTLTLQSVLSEHPGGPRPFLKALLESPGKDKCLKEAGLDSLDDFMSERLSPKASCFTFCLSKDNGYIDDDGKFVTEKFDTDELASHFPQEARDTIVSCLKNIDSLKECSDMTKIRNCFKSPKM